MLCVHYSKHFLRSTPHLFPDMNIVRFYFKVVVKSLILFLLLKSFFLLLDLIQKENLVNAARVISSHGILVLTFTNLAQLPMAKHFICNLRNLSIEDSILMVASDNSAHDSLLNFEPNINTIYIPSNTRKSDLKYGSRGFKDFIKYRTAIVLQLLSSNIPVFLVDTDHYWSVSLLEWLRQQNGWDIIIENNSIPPKLNPCAGMVFLNSTGTTIQVWKEVLKQLGYFRYRSCKNENSEQKSF